MIAALENAVTVTRSRFAAACSLRYTFSLMRMFNCLSGCFAVAMHTPFDSIDRRHCRVCDAMHYAWAHHRFRWVFRKLPGAKAGVVTPLAYLDLRQPRHLACQDFIGTRKALVDLRLLLFQLCRQPMGLPGSAQSRS